VSGSSGAAPSSATGLQSWTSRTTSKIDDSRSSSIDMPRIGVSCGVPVLTRTR
jgi:hypothetical protein